jgi:hypothetical protein
LDIAALDMDEVIVGFGVAAELFGCGQEEKTHAIAPFKQQAPDGQAVSTVVAFARKHQASRISVKGKFGGKISGSSQRGIFHQYN